jgi:hypothetical protein
LVRWRRWKEQYLRPNGHDAFVVYALHADGARATEVLTAIAAGADTYIVRLAGVSFDEADQILASITIAY